MHDSTDAEVPKVKVAARNLEIGFSRQILMDGEGNYAICSLPIGFYTLSAESKGFKLAEAANIVLQIRQQARIDLTLVP